MATTKTKSRLSSDNPIPTPSPFILSYKKIIEEKEPEEQNKEIQEKIASLETNEGWKEMKKIIDSYIDNLKKMIDPLSGSPLIDENDKIEIIGYKYMMISAIIHYLEEIKKLPSYLNEK